MKNQNLSPLAAVPFALGYVVAGLHWAVPQGWAVPLFVFVVIPVFDQVLGRDRINRDEQTTPISYSVILRLWVPIQLGLLFWSLTQVASPAASWGRVAGMAVSLGIVTGAVGITYAHELIHHKSRFDQFLGQILLTTVWYLHWKDEHLRGHHAYVGTPRDSATALRGWTVYRFIPRSVLGGWKSVAAFESERLTRKGRSMWSLGNALYRSVLLPALLTVAVALFWGPRALVLFLVQATVAVILLEIVNYVEHYGLSRRQLPSGGYERPHPGISWNSDHRLTNAFLVNLQRHSDHHARPRVPYPLLKTIPDAPQLPFGYATMVLLALVPPAFKRVVEPLIP